jgi:hypothetical protein
MAVQVLEVNVSPDLKQEVHLFLHSYTGYLESVKPQQIYISLVEKSRDIAELDENVEKAMSDAKAKSDYRLAETITSLHQRIKQNYFQISGS